MKLFLMAFLRAWRWLHAFTLGLATCHNRKTYCIKCCIIYCHYYLELCNVISICCISHSFANEGQIGGLDIIEHSYLYWSKHDTKSKMCSIV
jgi:hypothetical protein